MTDKVINDFINEADIVKKYCKKWLLAWKIMYFTFFSISVIYFIYLIFSISLDDIASLYDISILLYWLSYLIIIGVICLLIAKRIKKTLIKKASCLKNTYNNKNTNIGEIFSEIVNFQEEWIIKYFKENKINTREKILLIKDGIGKKVEINKYINPVILGTLFLSIWSHILDDMFSSSNHWEGIIVSIIWAIAICVILNFLIREHQEHLKFVKTFEETSGLKQLENLIEYAIIHEEDIKE